MLPTAFWLTPAGEARLVVTSHISSVIQDPASFGRTLDEITEAYENHSEPLGIEGKAREEIIKLLVSRGFIRVRRYPRNGYSITIACLDSRTRSSLTSFATKLLGDGIFDMRETDRWADVTITPLGGEPLRLSLDDIAGGDF